jgi:hypothetical protein
MIPGIWPPGLSSTALAIAALHCSPEMPLQK